MIHDLLHLGQKLTTSDILEYQDIRMPHLRAQHVLQAVSYAVVYVATRIAILFQHSLFNMRSPSYCPIREREGRNFYADEDLVWNREPRESCGLYVCIHGLRGSPVAWEEYRAQICAQEPYSHVFIPSVARQGNCSLEEASLPILEAIQKYIWRYPNAPIRIIGVSNGARIAGFLERNVQHADLKVASIAGVHFGTHLVRPLKYWDLLREIIGLEKRLVAEFEYGGEHVQNTLREWREKQTARARYFYATTEDEKVLDFRSSLPRIGAADRHFLVHGVNHESIVLAVRKHLLERMAIVPSPSIATV